MGRTIHCEHFNGLSNETCRAEVPYASVELGKGTPDYSLPCIVGARRNYNPLGAKCDKCKMPTPEEAAAEEAEMEKRMEDTTKARTAIVSHLGGPWKKGTPGAVGTIDCPVCEKPGALAFSRAGYNGHIHAKCSTHECVAWME